jgi:hypothetical protein
MVKLVKIAVCLTQQQTLDQKCPDFPTKRCLHSAKQVVEIIVPSFLSIDHMHDPFETFPNATFALKLTQPFKRKAQVLQFIFFKNRRSVQPEPSAYLK